MNQNFLYFLPSQDAGGKKKTFFFFEYLHDGTLKSDRLHNTNKALRLIKKALAESTRNIVIDTSTKSGRRLLGQLRFVLTEETSKRVFLASIFRTHRAQIEKYWEEWQEATPQKRKSQDKKLVAMFHAVRLLGGMRPMTKLDEVTLVAAHAKDYRDLPIAFQMQLAAHPVAVLLLELMQYTKGYTQESHPKEFNEAADRILRITHGFCRIVQDPFPIDFKASEKPRTPDTLYNCLFRHDIPAEKGGNSPINIANYFFSDAPHMNKAKATFKRQQPIMFRVFEDLKHLFGYKTNARSEHPHYDLGCVRAFHHSYLNFLDLLLFCWVDTLMPKHAGEASQFIGTEAFSLSGAAEKVKIYNTAVKNSRKFFGID